MEVQVESTAKKEIGAAGQRLAILVLGCIASYMDKRSRKTIQSLPDTLSSLMGFNKYLKPSWIESVSHIIKELPPTKPHMKVMVENAQNICRDDAESDTKVATIQDELVSLNAQLKQITLQRRESLNNYLDLKG